jgi:hypothetical protein
MIVDELVEELKERARLRTARDVRIGLGYTAVRLDDGGCGLAYSFRDEVTGECSALRRAGTIAGRPAEELIQWSGELDVVAAAVGLATLNALIETPPGDSTNILDLLSLGAGDAVGMVGYFGPLVGPLRDRCRALHIFERRPLEEPGVYPDWAAPVLLPTCDVVILSATAIVNRTIDALLEHASAAREIVVLGPSAPMIPELFTKRRVTVLSGVRVVDSDRLLQIVSEGGGVRQFGNAIEKVTVRLRQGS